MEPRVLNIKIRKDKKDDNVPNAVDFAKKYDIELDDVDDNHEISDHENEELEEKDHSGERDDLVIQDILQSQAVNKRFENMLLKLDEKNKEVERLCTLLETIEPVPGLDPEKFLRIIDGDISETNLDYRDSKVVQLAKKCRKLTVALNKERGGSHSRNEEVQQLQTRCDQLQRDLDLVSSPAARAAARDVKSKEKGVKPPSAPEDDKRELQQVIKQLALLYIAYCKMDDWRRKCLSSQEENKKLQRALTKEIGEGVTIDQAVDEGWRGRAQQIVMLKNKIKRLEAGSPVSGSAVSAVRMKTGKPSSDVDVKAMDDLALMMSDRQSAIEALTEDHNRSVEECHQLKQKMEAQKARIKILENESAKQKSQLKVLLDKAGTDDELVDALRCEVARLRQVQVQVQSVEREQRTLDASIPRVVKVGAGATRTASLHGTGLTGFSDCPSCAIQASEIVRLNRICSQQAAQLDTQDTIIKQLRASSQK